MYFNTCEYCGLNLDPGEKCDCNEERTPTPTKARKPLYKFITKQYDMSKYLIKIKINGEVLIRAIY